MKLDSLKLNPDNPRIIKGEKFKKLCQSLKDFPKMMELRPIVVDKDMMILGGNMRCRALQELGFTEIPNNWVKIADQLTETEKKRFIIEDNLPFGEWDWEKLANDFEVGDLLEWGFDESQLLMPETIDGFELPDGEKGGFEQITFTLTNEKADVVREALLKAKGAGANDETNENSNGNAISFICLKYNES